MFLRIFSNVFFSFLILILVLQRHVSTFPTNIASALLGQYPHYSSSRNDGRKSPPLNVYSDYVQSDNERTANYYSETPDRIADILYSFNVPIGDKEIDARSATDDKSLPTKASETNAEDLLTKLTNPNPRRLFLSEEKLIPYANVNTNFGRNIQSEQSHQQKLANEARLKLLQLQLLEEQIQYQLKKQLILEQIRQLSQEQRTELQNKLRQQQQQQKMNEQEMLPDLQQSSSSPSSSSSSFTQTEPFNQQEFAQTQEQQQSVSETTVHQLTTLPYESKHDETKQETLSQEPTEQMPYQQTVSGEFEKNKEYTTFPFQDTTQQEIPQSQTESETQKTIVNMQENKKGEFVPVNLEQRRLKPTKKGKQTKKCIKIHKMKKPDLSTQSSIQESSVKPFTQEQLPTSQNISVNLSKTERKSQEQLQQLETTTQQHHQQETTQQLEISTEIQQETTQLPETNTEIQQEITKQPETSTEIQQETIQLPETSTEIQQETTQQPETSTEIQQETTKPPETSTEIQQETTQQPETSTEIQQEITVNFPDILIQRNESEQTESRSTVTTSEDSFSAFTRENGIVSDSGWSSLTSLFAQQYSFSEENEQNLTLSPVSQAASDNTEVSSQTDIIPFTPTEEELIENITKEKEGTKEADQIMRPESSAEIESSTISLVSLNESPLSPSSPSSSSSSSSSISGDSFSPGMLAQRRMSARQRLQQQQQELGTTLDDSFSDFRSNISNITPNFRSDTSVISTEKQMNVSSELKVFLKDSSSTVASGYICPPPVQNFDLQKYVHRWHISYLTNSLSFLGLECLAMKSEIKEDETIVASINYRRYGSEFEQNDQQEAKLIWSPGIGQYTVIKPGISEPENALNIIDTDYETYSLVYQCTEGNQEHQSVLLHTTDISLPEDKLGTLEDTLLKLGLPNKLLVVPRCN